MTYSFLQNQTKNLITNYLNKHFLNNKIEIDKYELSTGFSQYFLTLYCKNNKIILPRDASLEFLYTQTGLRKHHFTNIVNKLFVKIFKTYGLTVNGNKMNSYRYFDKRRYNYYIIYDSQPAIQINFVKYRKSDIMRCYAVFCNRINYMKFTNICHSFLTLLMDPMIIINKITKYYYHPPRILNVLKGINKTVYDSLIKYWFLEIIFYENYLPNDMLNITGKLLLIKSYESIFY